MSILDINRPIWFMRQAGRHLPEYRKIRSKKRNFLDFCFDKKSIVEADKSVPTEYIDPHSP